MKSIHSNGGLAAVLFVVLGTRITTEAFVSPFLTSTPAAMHATPSCNRPYQCLKRKEQTLIQSDRLRSTWSLKSSAEESSDEDTDQETEEDSSSTDVAETSDDTPKPTLRQRLAKVFAKKEGEEKIPFRQRLAKMGLAAVLSYGFVSNMNYSVTISLAWFVFSKKTGLSPLAPGQWKPFLAVYAGFWVVNNFLRPARVAAAVAISTQFEKVVTGLQTKLKINKAAAVGITVFLANVVGTLAITALGIVIASALTQTPIFPPKA